MVSPESSAAAPLHPLTLVTPAWTLAHLRQVVVLDTRWRPDLKNPRGLFEEGHVPGARFADLDTHLAAPAVATGCRHPLPKPEAFRKQMAKWGIGPGQKVVVMDDAGGSRAGRLWFLLRYFGHDEVMVLDGGLQRWQGEGLPLERGPEAEPEDGEIVVKEPRLEWVVGCDEVAQLPEHVALLDARGAKRFRGEHEPLDPRPGHIPGAINLPWASLLSSPTGPFLPAEKLKELLEQAISEGHSRSPKEVWVACGSGVTACTLLLAASHTGFPVPFRLYANSFSGWSRNPQRPVARIGPPAADLGLVGLALGQTLWRPAAWPPRQQPSPPLATLGATAKICQEWMAP